MTTATMTLALFLSVGGAPPSTEAPALSVEPWVECTTPVQDAACAHLHRASELIEEDRLKQAGQEYRNAVQARRLAGQYPGEELWLLASFQYSSGKWRQAARTLDLLANEARDVGDLDRQAMALTNSILLYAANGRTETAVARLERLMPLLNSPYLPAHRVEYVNERLIGL